MQQSVNSIYIWMSLATAVLIAALRGNSKLGSSSSSGGGGSGPVTMQCIHSPQGAELLRTRVTAPAAMLTGVASWFGDDDRCNGPFSWVLQPQVPDVQGQPARRCSGETVTPKPLQNIRSACSASCLLRPACV
jgi:hypothetical protein